MEVVDPGHIYKLKQLGTDEEFELKFIKRSGGAIQYDKEWPGLQVQEVLRALIDRSKYLNDVLPCAETERAIAYLRNALWEYEARAYRRKRQELNREKPEHEEKIFPYEPEGIENLPIGEDGHIQYLESELIYSMYYDGVEFETIPGVDFRDACYEKAWKNVRKQ